MSTTVTFKDLDDNQKTILLENRILHWAKIVQALVQNLPLDKHYDVISKLSNGDELTPEVKDLLFQEKPTWDMTAHFLLVTLGNIVKNIKNIPKYNSDEIQTAGSDVVEKYEDTDLRILRNLLEHEPDYIVGSADCAKNAMPYVINLRYYIQGTFTFPSSESDSGQISFSIFNSPPFRVDPIIESVKKLKEAIQKKRDSSKQSNIRSPS